jgi:hypothetical protein
MMIAAVSMHAVNRQRAQQQQVACWLGAVPGVCVESSVRERRCLDFWILAAIQIWRMSLHVAMLDELFDQITHTLNCLCLCRPCTIPYVVSVADKYLGYVHFTTQWRIEA